MLHSYLVICIWIVCHFPLKYFFLQISSSRIQFEQIVHRYLMGKLTKWVFITKYELDFHKMSLNVQKKTTNSLYYLQQQKMCECKSKIGITIHHMNLSHKFPSNDKTKKNFLLLDRILFETNYTLLDFLLSKKKTLLFAWHVIKISSW